jgi:hypothetical protein
MNRLSIGFSFAIWRRLGSIAVVSLISACGGGGGGGESGAVTIPVTVAGLASGTSAVLQDTTGDSMTLSVNGSVNFPVKGGSGTAFTLSISSQPNGEFCNIQNAAGTVGPSAISSISCAQLLAGGSGSISAAGGEFTSPAADVTVPSGASLQAQTITVTTVAPPAGIPASLTPVGAAIDVALDQPTQLNAPLIVNLRYDASIVADETNLAVIHFNTTTNRYEPVTVLAQDTTAHSFTIESRTFSPFLVVYYDPTVLLPASHTVTNFSPENNGWNINNTGNHYFTRNGNCLGMSAFAIWYFQNEPDNLNGKFPNSGGDTSIAQLLATRAQLAQSQFWAHASNTFLSTLGAVTTAKLMKFYLTVFDQPLILIMGSALAPAAHASVLYGYNGSGFIFYDVNYMNASQSVSFDGTSFGTYNGSVFAGGVSPESGAPYTIFTYDAQPSLGRTEDFAELEREAAANFISSQYITVNTPSVDAVITSMPMTIAGSVSSNDPFIQMIAYIGSNDPVPVPVTLGGPYSYDAKPPLGENTIVLLAGDDLQTQALVATQSNWYANSDAFIFNVTVQVPVSILPNKPTLPIGTTNTVFSVAKSLPGEISDYANYSFSWSLTGDGSIGATSTVVTTGVPAILYSAPNQAGQANLAVSIIDPNGNIVGTATDSIMVGSTVLNVVLTQPWTDTGVAVNAGQQLTVTTTGTMDYWTGGCPSTQNCVVTPDGLPWSFCAASLAGPYTDPGLACFSLVGRIGIGGAPFQVGSSLTYTVPANTSGELYLGVNDNNYPDNTGSWTATIN